MKNYVKSARDTLAGLGFQLDHKDRELRTDRWRFTHANEPETVLTLNFRMSEQAARAVVQKARQVVGLSTNEPGPTRKARINNRQKVERAAEARRREAVALAAQARDAERKAQALVAQRRQQVGELDRLMRGRPSATRIEDIGGDWLTPEQVADEVGLSDAVVGRAIESEALPAYQIGKRVMVKVSDVRTWAERRAS